MVLPLFSNASLNFALMSIILSAIIFTSVNHNAFNFSSPKMVDTKFAPCNGGDEYIALAITFNCDSTTVASSLDAHTMDNVPTLCPYNPMFLAKLCANAMACPSLLNILNAKASLSLPKRAIKLNWRAPDEAISS